jgi:TRAP-type transport system periplasmic protein
MKKMKMKKKTPILLAAVLIAVAPAARAADSVTLKLAFPPPPISFFNGKVLAPWAKEIEAATHGAVKVQLFLGPTLANFGNIYDRILNGVIDLGWGLHGPFGRQFQKSSVVNLPGIPNTGTQCSAALWQLLADGTIADEYDRVKPLALGCFSGSNFIAAKPIRSIDDFKGMKIYVGSKLQGQIVEHLGGAPITGNTSEIYQGLQRGTYEAAATGWAAVAAFKLFEVSKAGFEAPMGNPTNFLFMNKDAFAKLPEAARKAIDAHSGAPLALKMGRAGETENAFGHKLAEKIPGYTFAELPAKDLPQFQRTMQPIVDEWVKTMPDGAKILAAYKAALAKFGDVK